MSFNFLCCWKCIIHGNRFVVQVTGGSFEESKEALAIAETDGLFIVLYLLLCLPSIFL